MSTLEHIRIYSTLYKLPFFKMDCELFEALKQFQ